jgi:MscS family membrane protein
VQPKTESRWIVRLTALFLLSASLGGAPPVAAQEADAAPTTEETPEVPAGLASPRATMRTFLEAFDPETAEGGQVNRDQALRTLDLALLPPDLHASQGWNLAVQLKDILDRTVLVDFAQIPDTTAAESTQPYPFLEREEGRVVLAPGTDPSRPGQWLFTPETVAAIPVLWRATESQDLVEGVEQAERTGALWLRAQMPVTLRTVTLGLERWQWFGLFLLPLLGLALLSLFGALFRGTLVRALAPYLKTVNRKALAGAGGPLALLLVCALGWSSLLFLDLPLGLLNVLHTLLWLLIGGALVWTLFRLVDLFSAVMEGWAKGTESRYDDLLVPLIRKSLKVLGTVFALVFVASNLGFNVTSLLAGVGLGGLAFALAAQDTVRNFFGSLTVVFDRPFKVGDWVVVAGVEGTVEEVGVRSTRIRTFYNSLISLPNANLINAHVDNYGERRYRRWNPTLGVTYSTPPAALDAFCEGIRELIRNNQYTRKDYFHVYVKGFGPSSLDIMLYLFFDCPSWDIELQEKHRLSLDILRLSHALGIDFAFPTQTVHLDQGEGEVGDRPPEDSFPQRIEALRGKARSEAGVLSQHGLGAVLPGGKP